MSVRALVAVAALGLVLLSGSDPSAQQVDASRGCNLYQMGEDKMNGGKFADALQDFDFVLSTCGQVEIRAQAQLQRGRIFLRVWPRRFAEARSVANTITNQFVATPSAPDGFILLGLVELAESRNFDAALNQFERVHGLKPSPNQAAEAYYRTAETLRLARRFDEARRRFEDVTLRYPSTVWSARALIGSATCSVRLGQVIPAMEALQRVRRDFAGSAEAGAALERNTILHRLGMRGAQQSAQFLRSVGAGKYQNAVGLALESDDAGERIVLGHRDGIAVIAVDTGQQVATPTLTKSDVTPTAVGLAPGGGSAIAREWFLSPAGSAKDLFPGIPQREGKPDLLKIVAFAPNWKGEWLIADGKTDAILKFSSAGDKYLGVFAPAVPVRRLVQNDLDDVAVINERTRGINVYTRDGALLREIPRRVVGAYDWDTPADLAFDAIGNLYVLDGGKAAVNVFDADYKFMTAIQLSGGTAAPLRRAVALTVDRAGRIYVLDRDGQQVLAFQ